MKKFLLLLAALLLLGWWLIWSGEVDATEIYLQGKVYAAEVVGNGEEETKIELAEYQVEKIQRSYEEWVKDFEKRKAELEEETKDRSPEETGLVGRELQKLQESFDATKVGFEQQKVSLEQQIDKLQEEGGEEEGEWQSKWQDLREGLRGMRSEFLGRKELLEQEIERIGGRLDNLKSALEGFGRATKRISAGAKEISSGAEELGSSFEKLQEVAD